MADADSLKETAGARSAPALAGPRARTISFRGRRRAGAAGRWVSPPRPAARLVPLRRPHRHGQDGTGLCFSDYLLARAEVHRSICRSIRSVVSRELIGADHTDAGLLGRALAGGGARHAVSSDENGKKRIRVVLRSVFADAECGTDHVRDRRSESLSDYYLVFRPTSVAEAIRMERSSFASIETAGVAAVSRVCGRELVRAD